jgi:predicted S18 family serine protease
MVPIGFPVEQDRAIQALGNIQQTIDAADARAQQAGDQVILSLQEALKQSDDTNRELAGRLSLALELIEALTKRVEKLEKDTHNATMSYGKIHHYMMEELIALEASTSDARNAYYAKRL